MPATRITDLEKFSLEEVWRPYWPSYDRGDLPRYVSTHGNLERLTAAPVGLTETAEALKVDDDWSRMVLGRLTSCRYTFPDYVQHPLVDIVRLRTGAYLPGDPVPPSFEGYEAEVRRVCAALGEASDLMDQLLLDVGAARPIAAPDGVNAWRRKAGLL